MSDEPDEDRDDDGTGGADAEGEASGDADEGDDAGADEGDADEGDADEGDDAGADEADDEADAEDDEHDDDSGDAEEAALEPKEPDKKKGAMNTMIGVLGFLVALGGGFAVGQLINRDDPYAEVESGPRLEVRLRGDEPQMGPDDALVTIIEFADYQCPYCQQASPPLLKAMKEYEGKVRLIYKHMPLPFHKQALPAAKAAWAAHQQGVFWPIHEALFHAKASLDQLPAWAKEYELDPDKLEADMASPAASESIDDDMKAAAVLGISGTPAFVVNGHHYKGKRTYPQWKQIIEAEMDAAKATGVAPAQVYETLMKDALDKKAPAPQQSDGPDPDKRYQVYPEGRASLGPDDALVTIVEFSDFQCPFCARMSSVPHELVERHPDVRFVFRNRPLQMHEFARPAALAALAAGRQGKFWEMHDKLFGAQKEIPEAVKDDFSSWAEELGLDVDQFKADFADPALGEQIDEDIKVARRFMVNGTPGTFVNGRFVNGAAGADAFEMLISEERAEAQKLVDSGVPKSEVLTKLLGPALQRVMPTKQAKGG